MTDRLEHSVFALDFASRAPKPVFLFPPLSLLVHPNEYIVLQLCLEQVLRYDPCTLDLALILGRYLALLS